MHFNLSRVLLQMPPVGVSTAAGWRTVRVLYVRYAFRIRYQTPPRDRLPKASCYTANQGWKRSMHTFLSVTSTEVCFAYTFPSITASACMKPGQTFS